ncbi:MAG: hypothetical protein HRS57_00400 [Mycoplasmataceae bacterium]|nr:hypothetical protein [Mycoplasmataceae bacterium]
MSRNTIFKHCKNPNCPSNSEDYVLSHAEAQIRSKDIGIDLDRKIIDSYIGEVGYAEHLVVVVKNIPGSGTEDSLETANAICRVCGVVSRII